MSDQEQGVPEIEFPCDYPIKVLGRQQADFEQTILAVFEHHAPGFDPARMTVRDSNKGTFVALTIPITATGPEQLSALHEDLMATGMVQMVI